MYIEPGTKIIRGLNSLHDCVEKNYKYEEMSGILEQPSGARHQYNMFKCNKCDAIVMSNKKVNEIEKIYHNYIFLDLPKKKATKPLTKKQIRNNRYLIECAIAEAQGKPKPRKKGQKIKPSITTPDYVFRGEAPAYMQRNASHPLSGGGVSPR